MRPPYLLKRVVSGVPQLVAIVENPGSGAERERAIEWAKSMFRDSDVHHVEVRMTPGTQRAIARAEAKRQRKAARSRR